MTLPDTSLRLSRLVFGGWAIGGHGWGKVDDNTSIRAVRQALELGINVFDTADVYGFGHSERILSAALGAKRHDVIVSTKFGVTWDERGKIGRDCSPQYVVRAVDASLRRLRIDRIPMYFIHWPDPSTPIDSTLEALSRCQDSGKVGYIGCSNFPLPLLEEAHRTKRLTFVQLAHNAIRRADEQVLSFCREAGIRTLAYDVLGKGLLTGKYRPGGRGPEGEARSKDALFSGAAFDEATLFVDELARIGQRLGKTAGQVAIRWVLDDPSVDGVVIGMKTPDQVVDNMRAVDWNLTRRDRNMIDETREQQWGVRG